MKLYDIYDKWINQEVDANYYGSVGEAVADFKALFKKIKVVMCLDCSEIVSPSKDFQTVYTGGERYKLKGFRCSLCRKKYKNSPRRFEE